MLDPSEYVEQAYLFQLLGERMPEQVPMQELLEQVRFELLATTRLPMAVDFMLTELKHSGIMSPAMRRLSHYFTPFQSYLVTEAEDERGWFDMRVALKVLEAEARYRSDQLRQERFNRQGLFFFQFETLSRNRLKYDAGLKAVSDDPVYDADWNAWILEVRKQVGFVDLADLIFLRSAEYTRMMVAEGRSLEGKPPTLFGEKEGRIARANRRKDPLYLFSAMQRHLGYPAVPRLKPHDPNIDLVPQLMRRMERLEARIKLMEEENRAGIDITKFYGAQPPQ